MMNSLLTMSTFVVMMLFAIGYLQMLMAEGCAPNEIKANCAPPQSCQPSCDNPDGTVCPLMCDRHPCVCKEGFIRDNDNNFQCVKPSQCTINTRAAHASKCGPNEVERQCAPLQQCQPSCDNPNGTICLAVCSKNPCECKKGFIHLSKNNLTCVEKTQCNANETVVCGENEVYDSCANPCQPSCVEPDRQACPTLQCLGGCICKPGYFRNTNDITSPCVQCPQILN